MIKKWLKFEDFWSKKGSKSGVKMVRNDKYWPKIGSK